MSINVCATPRFSGRCGVLLCLGILLAGNRALGGDSAALISMSITNGTRVTPRSIYTETWTFTNNGTTTWKATSAGYTLNLTSLDSLGLMQLFTNVGGWYQVSAIIGSGKNIAPGQTASFSIDFIAPEAAGSYTDSFQLNTTAGVYFGPTVTVQVVVGTTGNTNVYDRCRAISFANNYAAYYCPDGYFWTNGGNWSTVTPDSFTPVPTATGVGDDCAHFVSYCIGNGPYVRGGGMSVPSRVPPTYGEPGAPEMINSILLAPGFGVQVSSLSQLEPGDVIGWNWESNKDIADIDHVTLYMGNGLVSCHAASALDVDPSYFGTNWVWHLIHILDYPTLWTSKSGNKMTFMWTTNWSGYALYSASSIKGAWTKISTQPTVTGITNKLTLTLPSSGAAFYRLEMP
jgi:hypothetical protein